jgi:hypothetical protein
VVSEGGVSRRFLAMEWRERGACGFWDGDRRGSVTIRHLVQQRRGASRQLVQTWLIEWMGRVDEKEFTVA